MEMFVLLSEVSAIYSRMIGDYKSMEYISKVREAKRRMGDWWLQEHGVHKQGQRKRKEEWEIDEYKSTGYLSKVRESEEKNGRWHLPHAPIVRPDKSTTKVRIVLIMLARHDRVSLNNVIHQGQKLQRNLVEVLPHFRHYGVCLMCDIKEMYLQVQLAPSNQRHIDFWVTEYIIDFCGNRH